jgi:elongation factor Ts
MNDFQVTTRMVQELRQRTGAGMMDCKNALAETRGDMDKAVEYLRARGIAKAEKRAGRVASEGRIVSLIAPDGKSGALLELNSETDFVARNDDFGAVARSLAEQLLEDRSIDAAVVGGAEGGGFLARQVRGDGGRTVQDVVTEASAKTGENVLLRRYARFATEGTLGTYVHHNGRVAVMVEVTGPAGPAAADLAKKVAEHVAAGVPEVPLGVAREDVPAEVVERERRIAEEKARGEGKPENILGKIVEGQVRKFYSTVTLLEQPWVRVPEKTIGQLVEEASREAGGPLTIRRFVRYRMGEE